MRTDKAFVHDTVKAMLAGSAALVWPYVSDEIRDALIDSAVMDRVRLANEDSTITVRQLIDLRSAVAQALEDGVFVGKVKRGLTLDRVREERYIAREVATRLAELTDDGGDARKQEV